MTLVLASVIFALLGIAMVVFHRQVGVGICRVGKAVWNGSDTSSVRAMAREVMWIYDEKKVPKVVLVLGWVFVVESVLFLLLSIVYDVGG